MKLTATKKFTFEAAHFLEGYEGMCGSIHGHSYTLEVTVSSDGDRPLSMSQAKGMIIEFSNLKGIVNRALIDRLDHSLMVQNTLTHYVEMGEEPAFKREVVVGVRPTTENLALWMFEELYAALIQYPVKLEKVRLQETATGWCEVTA